MGHAASPGGKRRQPHSGRPSAGGGETPIVAVAPAIANAIFSACGKRLRAMPLAPRGKVP